MSLFNQLIAHVRTLVIKIQEIEDSKEPFNFATHDDVRLMDFAAKELLQKVDNCE